MIPPKKKPNAKALFRGLPEVDDGAGRIGPTMAAWKAAIPQDIEGEWPSSPRQLTSDELLSMAMDASTPMGAAGTISRTGSRLIATPKSFSDAKSALKRLLNASAEAPFPPEIQGRRVLDLEHSSGKLFEAPRIDRDVAATGAGDFWQGPGFYGSDEPAVTKYYRDVVAKIPSLVKLPSGRIIDLDVLDELRTRLKQGTPLRGVAERIEDMAFSGDLKWMKETLRQSREDYQRTFKEWMEGKSARKKLGRSGRDMIEDPESELYELRADKHWQQDVYNDASSNIQPFGKPLVTAKNIPGEVNQATYRFKFAADPDELFDLQRAVNDQPSSQRLIGALNEISLPATRNRPAEGIADRAIHEYKRSGDPLTVNELIVGNNVATSATRDALYPVDQFKIMDALRDKGIVGNQYLTQFARKDPTVPRSYNYVAQDPSRVRLTDVWAAAPIGVAMGAANQQEQQKPKRRAALTQKNKR